MVLHLGNCFCIVKCVVRRFVRRNCQGCSPYAIFRIHVNSTGTLQPTSELKLATFPQHSTGFARLYFYVNNNTNDCYCYCFPAFQQLKVIIARMRFGGLGGGVGVGDGPIR